MRESTALKQNDLSDTVIGISVADILPVPRTLGVFVLILTFLAFTAGSIRNEFALILVGAVFLAVLGYCFLTIVLLSCIHRKRVRSVSAQIITKQVSPGNQGICGFTVETSQNTPQKRPFLRLPGILIRYEIRLTTKDGRSIRHLFDPDSLKTGTDTFIAPDRGAYYTRYDEFGIFDVPGFFRLTFRIPQTGGPRLLVTPKKAAEPLPVTIQSGGTVRRNEPRFLRTDNLTDHRPYIPGDDPRRINWKLYGHLGDLFVREGEPEPPPHARLLIIVDTQSDPALYTDEAARRGVDGLCENALALAVSSMERGIAVSIGYTGGDIQRGTQAELAAVLAYPAALPLSAQEELPYSPDAQGIVILALPRGVSETLGLDRLLAKQGPNQSIDLIFLYEGNQLERAAETCTAIYSLKHGIHPRSVRLGS
ncbi:MAG: DUF58 domain-containing protein [Treponema sp.]|nr:DUF58 domain-containing protein [Treponema sp.]